MLSRIAIQVVNFVNSFKVKIQVFRINNFKGQSKKSSLKCLKLKLTIQDGKKIAIQDIKG